MQFAFNFGVLCALFKTFSSNSSNQSAIVILKTYLIMGTQLVGFIRVSRNEFDYVTKLYFLSDYTPVMMKVLLFLLVFVLVKNRSITGLQYSNIVYEFDSRIANLLHSRCYTVLVLLVCIRSGRM